MARQTQVAPAGTGANAPRETRNKLEDRCDKVSWKIKKLESHVWKLEWQVRADAPRLLPAERARLKKDLEEMIEDLSENVVRDLQALASRL
jgi:hypothetical protein